ncbi:MAG TPA: PAS domain S-box protein, partial [Candidatus Deferrimicrobium sp.]
MSKGRNSDGIEAPVEERAGETKSVHDLLHTLIDLVPAPIFLKDRENRFLLVNRSLAEAAGFSQEEMVGHSA